MGKKYQIELTERQLQVYKDALEFYSRFLAGQVDALPPALEMGHKNYYKIREKAEDHLFAFKGLVFPDLMKYEHHGIGFKENDDPTKETDLPYQSQVSYEMYREVNVMYAKQSDNQWNVYNSPTLKYSNEPLPVVKIVEGDENDV